jgi:hypothetical protein
VKRYRVTAKAAVIPAGIIALDADQAKARSHNLKAAGTGRFEIVRPIEFKAGEEFGYDGALPKSIAEAVDEIETRRAAKPKQDDPAE